jgi:hypothetical protein
MIANRDAHATPRPGTAAAATLIRVIARVGLVRREFRRYYPPMPIVGYAGGRARRSPCPLFGRANE